MESPVGRPWQDTGSRYSDVPYRFSVEDTECFLIDLEIGAKYCRMKRIPPKDNVAGRTGFHTKTMILRIVIYKVAINLLAGLEWKT